jgi:hypothetical protein
MGIQFRFPQQVGENRRGDGGLRPQYSPQEGLTMADEQGSYSEVS